MDLCRKVLKKVQLQSFFNTAVSILKHFKVCKAENTDIVVEEFDDDPNVSKYRMTATSVPKNSKNNVSVSEREQEAQIFAGRE